MIEGLQPEQMSAALEALLFVTSEPVSAVELAKALEVDVFDVENALIELATQLEDDTRGIQLREVAGGWRLYTHPAYHELIEKYVLSWDTRRMSQAALEVLAIVAYGEPITRMQISTVRGVNSDSALNTLLDRGYVREVGPADAPGNPMQYATTATFLEKFGLVSTQDLPPLEEFAPDDATARLIRERLGAPVIAADPEHLPSPEILVADAQASLFGAVEKIDFDKLTFDTDDE